MNILIAGGAGFIGSHLTDALLAQDHRVVCVDNLSLGGQDLISHHFQDERYAFYQQDICDRARLDDVFSRHAIERVYHLAANSDIRKGGQNPDVDLHNTLNTTITLLGAMRNHGVKELFFASTSAIYGDKQGLLREDTGDLRPISYYGGAKLASEACISAFTAMNDLRVNVIRFPNVVGPRLTHGAVYDFVAKLKKNPRELEILGDGMQEKPYIYVLDLVEAILSMCYTPGMHIFNAGVETATTVKRIADIVCEEMGLDGVQYRFTGGSVGWLGDVPKFQYDLSKIHDFGWKAKHSSDEAVRLAARSNL